MEMQQGEKRTYAVRGADVVEEFVYLEEGDNVYLRYPWNDVYTELMRRDLFAGLQGKIYCSTPEKACRLLTKRLRALTESHKKLKAKLLKGHPKQIKKALMR